MKKQDKLLLVGGDIATPDVIAYCKELGVYTIMTNDLPYENNPFKQMADEAWEIPVEELDILEAKCREVGVTAVFAGVNEHNLDMTKALAERLGLPFYASDEAWACTRDKGRFKEHCAAVGLDVPKRYKLDESFTPEDLAKISYPVMVKPADGCGSRGLSLCNCEADIKQAYKKAKSFSRSGEVIVEDYIDGIDVIFTYSLIDQKPVIHQIDVCYPVKLNGRRTIGVGAPSKEFEEDFEKKHSSDIERLFDRLGIKLGSLNIQTVFKNGRYYVYEMGYRLEGAPIWKSLKVKHGSSPLEMLVDIQLGRKLRDWRKVGGIGAAFVPVGGYFVYCNPGKIHKITGLDELKAINGVSISLNRYKEGDVVEVSENMFNVAFVLMVAAKDASERVGLLKRINDTIHFYDENGNDMLNYFEDYYMLENGIESL